VQGPPLASAFTADAAAASRVAEVLRAMAHPLRVRIVAMLCGGEETVSGLARSLAAAQPIVSQHLRVLRLNGLVAVRRRDGFAYYSLVEESLRGLITCVERFTA
jgi:ArsR family transcriptional regulator